MDELKMLDDQELLRRTAAIAQKEREVTVMVLRHLREVERRRLYLDVGFPSLYEYVVKELKFSEGAAYRRIQAMRLLKDLPEAEKQLNDGTLSITTASKIQSAAVKAPAEEKQLLVNALAGKSTREAERELAKIDPKNSKEFTRWISSEEVQLTFSLEKEKFKSLQELQSLRSHKDIQKTYKVIVADLVELGQEKWNPLRRNATSAPKSHSITPGSSWKSIPPLLRRQIWQRDQGACSYRIPGTNRTCGSRDLVQIDHIHPLGLGGKNEPENLRLLCAAHNRNRAEKTYFPSGRI